MEGLKYYICLCLVIAPVIRANPASPPSVEVSAEQLNIGAGESDAVTCTPGGYPLPSVHWRKHDGEFGAGTTINGNTLTVGDAQNSDSGYYVCTGVLRDTVVAQKFVYVEIENAAPPPRGNLKVTVSQRTKNIPRGGSASIECTPEGNPLPKVEWVKSDGEFGDGVRQSGNTLIISDARQEDHGDYTCQGIVDGTVMATDYLRVDITDSVPPAQGNSKVTVSQRTVSIPTGGSGSIECIPEGNPLPTVEWVKADGEFRVGVRRNGNTLIISDAREEDQGHYVCNGIVDETVMSTDYSSVYIEDAVPPARGNPKVTVSQKTLNIPKGGSARIVCTPEGNPLPTVQWTKSDGEFGNGVRQSGNTLMISDARDEDRGHYACQGIVDGTQIVADYSRVDIEDAVPPARGNPKVTVSQKTLNIPKGGSASIVCTPEGNPLPTVQWTKSDGEFGNGVRQSGNTLMISDARDEDRGHYACQGIVDGTQIVADYSRVDIEDAVPPARGNPKVTVSQKTLNIPKGGSASIVCTPEGNPLPTVQWTKSDGEFGNGVRQSGNTLMISDARDEDRGHYACQGIVDGTQIVADYSRVDIEDAVPPARGNPKVTVSQKTLNIPKGGSARIVCTPEGNPLPTVQWTKSDGEFGNGVRQSGNTLMISDARDEDRGHYACQGIVDGTQIVADYSRVDIEDAVPPARGNPKVTVSQKTLSIPKGGSASIVCTPEGNPLPTVQWTKSDGEFGNGVRQSGNTLMISDARDEDRGHYACQGIVDGTQIVADYSRVDIEDAVPPARGNPKVTVSQKTLSIPKGGSASIVCTPEGNPLPAVQWTKSDGEFGNGVRQSGNTLMISDAREEDRGHYACQGIVEGTLIVTDYSRVDIINVEPSAQSNLKVTVSQRTLLIPLGGRGTIECTPGGNPLPRVQWIKSDGEYRDGISQSGNTLIISDARVEDRGHYVCQGIVDGTVMVTNYSSVEIGEGSQTPPPVTTQMPQTPRNPKVTVSKQQLRILLGESGSIECTPEGNPLPTVRWIKADGEFRSGIRQNGNTLIISEAQKEDSAHYVCQGIVDGTLVATGYSAVEIESNEGRPDQLPEPVDIIVTKGADSTISCDFDTGDDEQQVTWARSDQRPLPQNAQIVGNALLILSATQEDSGEYQCRVTASRGGFLLRAALFRLEVLPLVSVHPAVQTVTRGQAVTIECAVDVEGVQVTWDRVNNSLSSRVENRGSQLHFSGIEVEDAGYYRCSARNRAGISSGIAQVIVNDVNPPTRLPRSSKVIVSERELIIPTGGSATIECIPEGNPLPTVQWIKSNGEFRDGVRQSGNTLIFSNARNEDRGHYVCQGIVDGTVMLTNYTRVDVRDVPQTSSPANLRSSNVIVSQTEVTVPRGESVSIGCTPEGSPLPTVRWIKSNGEFRDGVRQSGNTLIISDAREEDRGHYACQGIVDGTVMVTDYSRVDVENVNRPTRLPRSSKVIVSERELIIPTGGSATIECTPEGNPLPTVQWIKSNGEFRDGVRQSGNTLIFSDARDEDRGHYVCQGIVDGTLMVTDYSRVDVQNVNPPTRLPRSTKVIVSERELIIPTGGSASIECTPEGNPLPTVHWIKSNGEFRDGIRQDGNTLIISDARKEDGGHYACQGIVDGTVMVTGYSRVDIEDEEQPPVVTGDSRAQVSVRQVKIPRGGNKSVECTPEGNPLPTIQWRKHEGAFSVATRQSGNALEITDAQEQDGGYYACDGIVDGIVAWTDYLAVEIESSEPISQALAYPRVTVNMRHLRIPRGGSMAIDCTPEGYPLPTIQWTKDEGNFDVGTRQSGNSLIIKDAQEEDRGNYVCSAIVNGETVFSDYLTVEIQYNCELPKDTGSCRAAINRWYYDPAQQKCQKFIWGGCGGNKNNFETEEQCSLECESMRPVPNAA